MTQYSDEIDVFNQYSPRLIKDKGLVNSSLASEISHAKFIFVGEIHGAKQNCDVLYTLITNYGISSLGLELNQELKPFVDTCIASNPDFNLIDPNYLIASVLSIEMAKTLAVLCNENKLKQIHYINANSEKGMASNISKITSPGPTLILMGNWHTETEAVELQGETHISSYVLVKRQFRESVNIRYRYRSGSIYNYGNGIMNFDDEPTSSYALKKINDACFELIIPKATPIFHEF